MSQEWIDNPKQNPPPEMELVEITGCDYMGKWTMNAMRKTYVKPPHKKMPSGCWRWVNEKGDRLDDQCAVAWRKLNMEVEV